MRKVIITVMKEGKEHLIYQLAMHCALVLLDEADKSCDEFQESLLNYLDD